MAILVTGANGFVGRAVCAAGARQGLAMIACQRQDGGGNMIETRLIDDIAHRAGLAAAMDGCEAVIHLVGRTHVLRETESDPLTAYRAVNVAGTEAIIAAAEDSGLRRIVFMSSIKVNGEETPTEPFSERSVPAPEDPYGATKLEAETLLRDRCAKAGLEWVILRPPLVYGPGAGGNFNSLLKLCDSALPLPFGAAVSNRRSMIAVENLAGAALAAATHGAAADRVFLVRDGTDLSTARLAGILRQALDRPARLLAVPPGLMRGALRALGQGAIAKRLFGSLMVDDRLIRETLGWTPELTAEAALARTAQLWKQERRETTGA